MRDINFSNKSLTQYFYQGLDDLNKSSICPLPQEFIYYSSLTLDKFSSLETFFNPENGQNCNKILGMNLLEAELKASDEKKKIYKDVGDTILVQMALFPDYLKGKTLNKNYYMRLGKTAYFNMEKLNCTFYDIPHFYRLFSSSFEQVINLIETFNSSKIFESYNDYLISLPVSDEKVS
jgi:hypothetical protein